MAILKLKKKDLPLQGPIFFKDVDIEKVLVSNKTSFDKKNCRYFIGYLCNDHKFKPLHIMFPKKSAYVESSDG